MRTRLILTSLIAASAWLTGCPALAQWQWKDDTGRKVFSDTPPPASVPESAILVRPSGARRAAAAAPAPTAPAGAPAPAAAKPDAAAAAKADAAAAQRAKTEAAKIAAERAENCQHARQALVGLNSGVRMAVFNARGEREFLDERAMAAERQRAEGIVRSDCAPQ